MRSSTAAYGASFRDPAVFTEDGVVRARPRPAAGLQLPRPADESRPSGVAPPGGHGVAEESQEGSMAVAAGQASAL